MEVCILDSVAIPDLIPSMGLEVPDEVVAVDDVDEESAAGFQCLGDVLKDALVVFGVGEEAETRPDVDARVERFPEIDVSHVLDEEGGVDAPAFRLFLGFLDEPLGQVHTGDGVAPPGQFDGVATDTAAEVQDAVVFSEFEHVLDEIDFAGCLGDALFVELGLLEVFVEDFFPPGHSCLRLEPCVQDTIRCFVEKCKVFFDRLSGQFFPPVLWMVHILPRFAAQDVAGVRDFSLD